MRHYTRELLPTFAAVALVTVLSISIVFAMGLRVTRANAFLLEKRNIMSDLESLLSTLKDAETGERGYLLTGDALYLEPYHDALAGIDDHLDLLERRAAAGDVDPERARTVADLIARRLALLDRGIQLRRDQNLDAALGVIQPGVGKRLMDEIRTLVGSMVSQAADEVQQAYDRRNRAHVARTAGSAVMALTVLAFLLWAFRRIQWEIRHTEQQRQLLAVTLASIGDGVIITDNEGRVTYLNEEAERLTGWKNRDAEGKPLPEVFNIINEDTREPVESPVEKVLRRGAVVGLANHTLLLSRNGQEYPIDDSGAPIRNPDGSIRGVVLVFRDFTEHRRTEEELRNVALFPKENPSPVIRIDRRGLVLFANPASEILPEALRCREGERAPDILTRKVHETLESEGILEFDLESDGKAFAFVCAPIAEGGYVNFYVRDVTERRLAAEALRRSNARLNLLAETAGRLLSTEAPQAVVDTLCRNVMEFLDCQVFFNFLVGDSPDRLRLNAWAGISEEEARRAEWLDYGTSICGCVARDGVRFVLEDVQESSDPRMAFAKSCGVRAYACHPLLSQGRPIGTLSFGTRTRSSFSDEDLSLMKAVADQVAIALERRRAEEELRASKEASENASRAKDNFLAVLSHELRTPLTPVLAAVSMLQKNADLGPEVRTSLEVVRRNAELEARLIDDLLDLTRIARGKVDLDKRPTDLGAVLQRTVEVCMADIRAKDLEFALEVPQEPCIVEGDAARLQQVFWNLLKNAVKFTPAGGQVGIRCRRENDEHVLVEVYDSGEGFTPEFLPRLFSAFEQGDPNTAKRFGGLGLGLAISRSLVEIHGGSVDGHSDGKGKGAVFRVRLPLMPAAAPGPQRKEDAQAQEAPATGSLHILYVEDHADTAELMRELLELEGHRVRTAGAVAEALSLAASEDFDLLVSDLGLPDGSGLDLMRRLRARGWTGPGIALSGYGQEQDVRSSEDAGFDAHVVKPVDVERLLAVMAQVMVQTEAPPAARETS